MLIKTAGKSVWVKVRTITDVATLGYVRRVGRVRPGGWIRLSHEQWARRPGVDRNYRPAMKPK